MGARKQPDNRLSRRYGDRQAQVEEGGAASDVHGTTLRVGVAQHPRRISVKLDGVVGLPVSEPPRLNIEH